MAQLVDQFDPTLVFMALLPVGLAVAAWALQMACVVSDVEPPDYWQSLLCVVLIATSNVVLRFWINTSVSHPGLGYQVLWPLAMSAAIIAVMVRTGPFSAVVVTVCEGALCAGLYAGFMMASSAL